MSVRFNADEPYECDDLPVGSGDFTITCWGRLAVDRNDYSSLFAVDDLSGGSAATLAVETRSDGTTLNLYVDPGGSEPALTATPTSSAMTVGTWYRVALIKDGLEVTLIRAGATGSSTSGGVTLPGAVSLNRLKIGDAPYSGEWLNGNIANFKFYSSVLTQTEIDTEWDNWQAQRTANLIGHHKFQTAAETTNYAGSAYVLTLPTGTPTFEATNPSISDSPPPAALQSGLHFPFLTP